MKPYQESFIELLVEAGALKFGSFTLKSGRIAPYFFNSGVFFSGDFLTRFARAYAEALLDHGFEPTVIFGPAYKGIPLSAVTTTLLFSEHQKNLNFAYNRKEAKDHGEGSLLVGAPIDADSRVLILDDVVTAGTAIRDSLNLLTAQGSPQFEGVLIAINRMEKTNEGKNALTDLEEKIGAPVRAIVNLDDIIAALHNKPLNGKVVIDDAQLEMIQVYRAEYGI